MAGENGRCPLILMGSVLLIFSLRGGDYFYVLILGLGSSLMFLIIDFYYVSIDVISGVYMLDGTVQISCFGSWDI